MNRWELEQKIVIRALKDPKFKKLLLSQPKEAVLEFLKNEKTVNLPASDKLNIRVVEEKKDEWVLTLPYLTTVAEPLSDAEIEKLTMGNDVADFTLSLIAAIFGGCGTG